MKLNTTGSLDFDTILAYNYNRSRWILPVRNTVRKINEKEAFYERI